MPHFDHQVDCVPSRAGGGHLPALHLQLQGGEDELQHQRDDQTDCEKEADGSILKIKPGFGIPTKLYSIFD